MFGASPVILYSSLERTERFVRANSILGGVCSSEYKFTRANWSESGRVERIAQMAQASNSVEGVRSSGYELLERATSNHERSSEERWRLERPGFWEGFARATPEQESSSEDVVGSRDRSSVKGSLERMEVGWLERTTLETLHYSSPNLNFRSTQNSI